MHTLRPYQDKLIRDGAFKASLGHRRIIMQAPTGAGKSVIFATLIARYLSRNKRNVLIVCHREKLVRQSRKALYDWYGIIAEPVFAETKRLAQANVYSGMAETLYRRFTKNPNYIQNIGLLVVDEAHLGMFNKFIELHPDILVIGFTATPISASKKKPLNGVYHEIVCGPQINDLIHEGSLSLNITHRVKDNIDRSKLKIKNGEFDETWMADMMSRPKHVNNTVEAYRKFALGRKTIVFNCNIEHSKVVCDAFNDAGYICRHLDGYMPKSEAEATLQWFEETPNAILCNVAVATTGFDIPDISAVVINRATKSLPLYLQMAGRGSRIAPGKKDFKIIDMGKNYVEHGDWSDDRDWQDWFTNPGKPSDGSGVAPVKDCPNCEAMLHASVKVCPHCGADCSKAPVYDDELVEFETLVQGKPLVLDVPQMIHIATTHGHKDYAALHQIKSKIVHQARHEWRMNKLTDRLAYRLLAMYHDAAKVWCHQKGKRFNQWHKETTQKWLFEELYRVFKWEPQTQKEAA